MNDIKQSLSLMKTVEDDFEKKVINGPPECECKEYIMPLGHVISTTKAHLLMLVGDEDQSKKVSLSDKIKCYSGYDFSFICLQALLKKVLNCCIETTEKIIP